MCVDVSAVSHVTLLCPCTRAEQADHVGDAAESESSTTERAALSALVGQLTSIVDTLEGGSEKPKE